MKHGKKQDSVTLVQKNNNKHNQAIKLHLGSPDEGNKDFKKLL